MDIKKMKDLIELKKLRGSNRKPRYATRKLSIGLVSCILGFTLIISPSSVLADEATDATEAVEPADANPDGQPAAEDETNVEEKDDAGAKTDETVTPAATPVKAPVEETTTPEEETSAVEEFKLSDAQKASLEEAGYTDAEIASIEAEAKAEKEADENFDVDAFVAEKVAEKASEKASDKEDEEQESEKDSNDEEKDLETIKAEAIKTIEEAFAVLEKEEIEPKKSLEEYKEEIEKAKDKDAVAAIVDEANAEGNVGLGISEEVEKDGVKEASTTPVPNDTKIQDVGSIEQKIPFREKTSGIEDVEEGKASYIRYNTLEARSNGTNKIELTLNYWPQGGASDIWGTSDDPNAEYAGKYVISFDNPELYNAIQTITTIQGGQPSGEKSWTSGLDGRDWTMVMNNANTHAGVVNTEKTLKLEIALKGGKTLKDLGLDKTPLSFTAGIVGGKSQPKVFNKILANTLTNGFIMEENPNDPDPKANPELFRGQGVPTVSGDNKYNDGNFTKSGVGQTVTFDKENQAIVSRHTFKPTQNFNQSNDDMVVYVKEQIPKVLLPFIDRDNIYIGVMNDVYHPNDYLNSLGSKSEPVKITIDDNGLVDTSKVPEISISGENRKEQINTQSAARSILNSRVFEGTLGQSRTYTISYKLKEGTKQKDVLEAIAREYGSGNARMLFESWLESDFVDYEGSTSVVKPYSDNGEPTRRLINSYANAFFDTYYELSNDARDYEPVAEPITKEFGQPTTEEEVKAAVTVPDYPADKKAPIITIDDPSTLPDGNTPGTTDVAVTVTYQDGTVDKITVPVTVKEKGETLTDADKYEPTYTDADAEVGKPTTITAPNFTDKDGKDTTKPEGTKFALDEGAPEGATIDPGTGEIKYTPADGTEGTNVEIPVVVTYKDGTTDKVNAKVTVAATTPAEKDTDKYDVKYEDAKGKAGKETTVTPTVTDKDGKDTTAPEGTKYTLGDKAPEDAKIDENTGKVTYTPSEEDAGKAVEIPVVVTYPDKSTDNATAKINVEKLADVIDRTDDPSKPTPDGYVRVTFTNGEGVNEITNNKVYDVKEGVALAADKYPEVTAKDGYENPTWSPEPGTAITKENATITATATATTPAEKDADKYDPTIPEKTEVEDKDNLTDDEKKEVKDKIEEANKDKFPEGTEVEVDDKGNATITYPDDSTDTIPAEDLVKEKDKTDDKTDADKITPNIPEEKTGVKDLDNLTDKEKEEVKDKIEEANKDNFPEGTDVSVDDKGNATITYPDGSKDTIPASDLVFQYEHGEPEETDKPELKIADIIDPIIPEKTEVGRPGLTQREREEVERKIIDANKGNFPEGTQVIVDESGNATIIYPDGSIDTIPWNKLVFHRDEEGAVESDKPSDEASDKDAKGTEEASSTAKSSAGLLPETGEANATAIFGAAALSILAGLGLVAKRREDEEA